MKICKSLFAIALVASAFASCQKIEENNEFNTTKTVSFIATTPETKTAFGEKVGTSYPTLWTANDQKVKVSLNYSSVKDAEVTPASDFKTASFSVEINDDESKAYTFYSASPASAVVSLNASYKSWNFEVPSAQKPTVASVDEKAQILVAKTEKFTEFPTSVKMNYSHFTAYGKMSLLNLDLGDATINSISLTASKNWAGRWYYYPEDGTIAESSASATITLETSATENIWFACAPVDLSGETLKVTINTTKGPLVKEITLRSNAKFESGVINKFAVDMAGIGFEESKVYSLVTDISELTEGSEVIIAAAGYDVAISTTQNNNNRAQASVTKSESTITDPGDDVQIFTLETGTKDNTVAFNTGAGYIYAASSSSNYLRTQESNNDNGSFAIEINEDGVASIIAQGTNTRNTIRYNSATTNGQVFSCYESGKQSDVSIYKLDGSGNADKPLIVVDDNEYTITVADVENGTVQASATAAKKGTEITLTISPAEGYALDVLSVKDSENNDVEVKDNKFTMPASNVTVSATFVQSSTITVTKTMTEIVSSNNYTVSAGSDVTCYTSFKLNDIVTVSTSGEANCGSFWGTTTIDWRLYQAQNGDLTVTVPDGYSLVSVKFTYNNSNGGSLYDGSTAVSSNAVQTLSGQSKTYTVGSTTGKTNGQVRLTSIEVTYK